MSAHSKSIGFGSHRPWLPSVLGRVVGARRRRRAEAETISILSGLEDHTLADIGVARDQIPAIARRLARRYG